jgi:formylmethanofuran dehydrogenase subunit B
MVDVIEIDPADAMPSEDDDFIQVVRRFDRGKGQPQRTLIDIDVFVAETKERRSLADAFGPPAPGDLAWAVRQAVDAAEERGIERVYVADLTATVRD